MPPPVSMRNVCACTATVPAAVRRPLPAMMTPLLSVDCRNRLSPPALTVPFTVSAAVLRIRKLPVPTPACDTANAPRFATVLIPSSRTSPAAPPLLRSVPAIKVPVAACTMLPDAAERSTMAPGLPSRAVSFSAIPLVPARVMVAPVTLAVPFRAMVPVDMSMAPVAVTDPAMAIAPPLTLDKVAPVPLTTPAPPTLTVPPVPLSRLTVPAVEATVPRTEISGEACALGGLDGPAPPVARTTSPDACKTMPELTVMVPPASRVSDRLGCLVRLTLPATVIVWVACRRTLPSKSFSAVLEIVSGGMDAAPARTVPVFLTVVSQVPVPKLASTISRKSGSNKIDPARPLGAETVILPVTLDRLRPDTSTNPPSPPDAPPRALIVPFIRVVPDDSRVMLPPVPRTRASAAMVAPDWTVTWLAIFWSVTGGPLGVRARATPMPTVPPPA